MSKEYKLPPKNTIGVITNEGTIDICSKSLLTNPIKKPNKAKVKDTKVNKKPLKREIVLQHLQKLKMCKRSQNQLLMF